MKHLEKLIGGRSAVIAAIQGQGFRNALIFKSFSGDDCQVLNFLVEDTYNEDSETDPQVYRRVQLKGELESLIGSSVFVSTPGQMDSYYTDKLNSDNSVRLDQSNFKSALERVFATNEQIATSTSDASMWAELARSTDSCKTTQNYDDQSTKPTIVT